MARVNTSTFVARKGATLNCEKGHPIEKGQRYFWSKPRSAYRKRVRCMQHPFRPSELDNSKMSAITAAIEDANDNLQALRGTPEDNADSVRDAVAAVAETANDVAQEYRDAADASPTGLIFGEDYNERADAIESVAADLEGWEPDDSEPDFDLCENSTFQHDDVLEDGTEQDPIERGDTAQCEECATVKQEWWDAILDEAESALNDADFSA